MNYRKPDFYDSFSCLGGSCPITCCAGWQILIDEEKQQEYLAVPGSFGARLFRSVDWGEGAFLQTEERRCSFLNRKNLCDIYGELGSDMLCETCRKYPRHEEEFEELREYSLSLSCPEAARILLSQEGKMVFVEEADDREENWEDYEEFDTLLFSQLLGAREELFETICDRRYTLEERMELCLSLGRRLQKCLDDEEIFGMEEEVQRSRKYREERKRETTDKKSRWKEAGERMKLLEKLEVLQEEWTALRGEEKKRLERGQKSYDQIWDSFCGSQRESFRAGRWETWGEQLLLFFTYTYFCGAVYDGWIYSKVMLAVFSVNCIQDIACSLWEKQGGRLSEEDFLRLACRYARETEHSDQNLELLEENFIQA